MAWTEESIVEEFRTHLAYWQEKLRLRDLEFVIRVVDDLGSSQVGAWCSVDRSHGGSNPYAAYIRIRRGYFDGETRYDVWSTACHELAHVLNWPMKHAFDALVDHFSTAQMNLAKSLMAEGNEHTAYKLESILTEWFAADAPPKEVP